MHRIPLLLPLFAAACSVPRFTAERTVTMTLPLEGATTVRCETHNGNIRIEGGEQPDVVELVATLRVHGHTQEQADENLSLMEIVHVVGDGRLDIHGQHPDSQLQGCSPSYSFTLRVPQDSALDLHTHNGSIETTGTTAAIAATTHNGRIRAASAGKHTVLESHNGSIEVTFTAGGALDSSITTHNGGVVVHLHENSHGWLEATTHNGRITPPSTMHEASIEKHHLRCRIGDESTEGSLQIETHNGGIAVR